jgi:hypothetical protein
MILPWARVLISAGAHGLRRIPGQSVNLAHPIWRTPRAPAPLQGAPPVVFRAGLWVFLPSRCGRGVGGEGLHSPNLIACRGAFKPV